MSPTEYKSLNTWGSVSALCSEGTAGAKPLKSICGENWMYLTKNTEGSGKIVKYMMP